MSLNSERQTEKIGWIVAWVVGAVYVASIVRLTGFPMQDYANHIARADIMADLLFHHGSQFGQYFQLHLMPVPYVLPDLLLTAAVAVFGVATGAGLFTSLVILALPCALVFYARCCNVAAAARPFAFLLGLYLSIDWFFIAGFMAFRLAIPLVVVSLALAEVLRKRWSVRVYTAYLFVLVLGFLAHLSAPVFLGAALGVSALVRLWFRTTTLRVEIYLLGPFVVLLAAYFGMVAPAHATPDSVTQWAQPGGGRPWVRKIRTLLYEFLDFDRHLAVPALILFLACILWPLRRGLNRLALLRKPAVVEQLALAATFLGLYWIMPFETEYTQYTDVRALPMVSVALIFASLRLPAEESRLATEESATPSFGKVLTLGLAAPLAIAQLLYVVIPLTNNNDWINRYRAVVAAIPRGVYVLPVHTELERPYVLHVASHAVLDRGAIIPYLFSGNFDDPMSYFRYRNMGYAPGFRWYKIQARAAGQEVSGAVDWNRVACGYRFLLVTKPYDATFIRVPTMTVASNDAAALLAIDKGACRDGMGPEGSPSN